MLVILFLLVPITVQTFLSLPDVFVENDVTTAPNQTVA